MDCAAAGPARGEHTCRVRKGPGADRTQQHYGARRARAGPCCWQGCCGLAVAAGGCSCGTTAMRSGISAGATGATRETVLVSGRCVWKWRWLGRAGGTAAAWAWRRRGRNAARQLQPRSSWRVRRRWKRVTGPSERRRSSSRSSRVTTTPSRFAPRIGPAAAP